MKQRKTDNPLGGKTIQIINNKYGKEDKNWPNISEDRCKKWQAGNMVAPNLGTSELLFKKQWTPRTIGSLVFIFYLQYFQCDNYFHVSRPVPA
jgi:hypothetical protein